MKRTPIKRKAPLRAKAGPKRRPARRKRATDEKRLAWVRSFACCRCGLGPSASLPVEAHHPRGHAFGTGTGIKAADEFAIPLCVTCHHDLHSLTDIFQGFTRETLRQWQAGQVEVYRALWAVEQRRADGARGGEG